MRILEITSLERKMAYLPLLRGADPSDEMIMRYLPRGRMFLLEEEDLLLDTVRDGEAAGAAVAVDLGNGTCELKNLSVSPTKRRRGCGRMLIEHVAALYEETHTQMLAGVCRQSVPIFERCGFVFSHVAPRYYVDNYPETVRRKARLSPDLYYLRRTLQPYSVLNIYHLQRQQAEAGLDWAPEAQAL